MGDQVDFNDVAASLLNQNRDLAHKLAFSEALTQLRTRERDEALGKVTALGQAIVDEANRHSETKPEAASA